MSHIVIEGQKYNVIESLGYQHSSGCYVTLVDTPTGEKMIVKQQGNWRFWTDKDKLSTIIVKNKRI